MKSPKLNSRKAGFTLVELVIVIVVLGILAAVAVPKFVDFSSDAKLSACKGALGNMRSAIATQYAYSATPTGGGVAAYPVVGDLAGLFPQGLPDNPYSTGTPNAVVAGSPAGVPVTGGTTGDWAYDASTGEIWADTASGAGEAGL